MNNILVLKTWEEVSNIKKLGVYTLILSLVFSMIPIQPIAAFTEEVDSVFLDEEINSELIEEKVVLFGETKGQEIDLFESITAEESALSIPDETEVTLIFFENKDQKYQDYSLIRYSYIDDQGKEEQIEGFVHSSTVVPMEEVDQFKEERDLPWEEEQVADDEENTEKIDESEEKEPEEKGEEEEEDIVSRDNDSEEVNEGSKQTEAEDEIHSSTLKKSFASFSAPVQEAKESKTSKLGHIKSRNVNIYEQINGKSFKAGSQYTNAVYYIKKQATVGNETFYLISTRPSASTGVVGWVKAEDLSTRTHVGVDKKEKTFYIKGNGKATTKAWGGSKDAVYSDLSTYKNQAFKVHLTEKVGNNTWYRGTLNGKTVWLHSSYVYEATKSKTSLLGHIRSGSVQIYESIHGKSFKAGSEYTNAVYYIKEEAKLGNQTYYLISTRPSNTTGVVGWVKAEHQITNCLFLMNRLLDWTH